MNRGKTTKLSSVSRIFDTIFFTSGRNKIEINNLSTTGRKKGSSPFFVFHSTIHGVSEPNLIGCNERVMKIFSGNFGFYSFLLLFFRIIKGIIHDYNNNVQSNDDDDWLDQYDYYFRTIKCMRSTHMQTDQKAKNARIFSSYSVYI